MDAGASLDAEVVALLQQLLIAAGGTELMSRFTTEPPGPGSSRHPRGGLVVIMQGGFPPDGTVEGPPPASKASIAALKTVEEVDCDDDCPVCFDVLGGGGEAAVKEVPCEHVFHGVCIEKWLGLHGSCPVCRYRMPEEEEDEGGRKGEEAAERGMWVTFGFAIRDADADDSPSS